jgi:aminotransferase
MIEAREIILFVNVRSLGSLVPISPTYLSYQPSILRDITQWVDAVGGINLGQGVCQLPVPEFVAQAAMKAIAAGHNRYTAPLGIPALRQAVAQKLKAFNGFEVPADRIAITHGSTGAWEAVCAAYLRPGDEVVLMRPFYPYHRRSAQESGAVVRTVDLEGEDWSFDPQAVRDAIRPQTKLLVMTNPSNPTGKVYSYDELLCLGRICQEFGIWMVCDEVYEGMTFGGRPMVSAASIPEIADCVLTMGSFSKTFAITGWRVGYLVAPEEAILPLHTWLDRIYVCAPAPFQVAVAESLQELGLPWFSELSQTYELKVDLFVGGLRAAGWKPIPTQGAYYVLAQPPAELMAQSKGADLVQRMVQECGVGAVPGAEFVDVEGCAPRSVDWLRFCVSQPEDRLMEALNRLQSFKA